MKLHHTILAGFFLLALTGCEGVKPPHIFGSNEVPPEVVNAPRVVESPEPGAMKSASWMRLGDVPSKPSDFTSNTLIEQTSQEMRNDRAEADKLREEIEGPPPLVSPPAVQP